MPVTEIQRVQIEQRDVTLFSDYENGGKMWTGDGARSHVIRQEFSKPFMSPPIVHCSLSMWDISSEFNSRIDVSTENVTTSFFDIVIKTWADTRIARTRASWIAIGEARPNDYWDVD